VATYSLREFQRGLAIRMIKRLGVTQISLKDFHLPSRNRQSGERIQERRLDHRERRQY
jgi:hypothetical protein